ncbi:MAG: hypothetical protein JWM99_1785 [Verrucomicrobiales bacterium]|nr:hypothetical protein [Verrucomicrobiales bacterium]
MVIQAVPRRVPSLTIAFMFALGLLSGCGKSDGPQRRAIYGTVTNKDGTPIEGMITFHPAEGHQGVAANGAVAAGKYRFDSTNGPVSGPHKVLITPSLLAAKSERLGQIAKGETAAPAKPSGGTMRELVAEVPAKGSFEINLKLED